jgi:4-hydroxy-2-oxoglutarate aldolase
LLYKRPVEIVPSGLFAGLGGQDSRGRRQNMFVGIGSRKKGVAYMDSRFRGVFAPLPTPFDAGEEIAWPQLRDNLARWERTELTGVVVLGSNGEFPYLDPGEKERLIAFVRENFPRERPVIAGTGCESTRETIRLTRRAAALGADAALVLNPSYYKGAMTDAALKEFFLAVAEASPIPVLLYNMPRNTGINLSAELVAALSAHPNIAGVKDSGGNIVQIAETVAGAREGFAVFAGSGGFLLATLLMGGVGGTLAVANLLPGHGAKIAALAAEGRVEEARRLQLEILPLNAAVTTRWGVAGLKAALDLLGYYGGPPRRPSLPAGEDVRGRLRTMLLQAGALAG